MAKQAVYIQEGNSIDITLTSAVSVGEVIVIGELVGVANNAGEIGEDISVKVSGVWQMNAKTADAIMVGAKVYWDDTADELTTTDTDNTFAGIAITAKSAATAGTVNVRLGQF